MFLRLNAVDVIAVVAVVNLLDLCEPNRDVPAFFFAVCVDISLVIVINFKYKQWQHVCFFTNGTCYEFMLNFGVKYF